MSAVHRHPDGRAGSIAAANRPATYRPRASTRPRAGLLAALVVLLTGLVLLAGNPPTPAAAAQPAGLIGSIHTTYGQAVRVDLQGNYAYVTDWPGSLDAIDISDPCNPVLAGTVPYLSNEFQDVKVIGDYAYIANDASGLATYDISDPTAMSRAGARLDASSYTVSVDYDAAGHLFASHLYSGDPGLVVYDPPFPFSLAITYPANPMHMWEVDVEGSRVYITMTDGGPTQVLAILDFNNATPSLSLLGSISLPADTYGTGLGLKVVGDYAYLTTTDNGSTFGSLIIVNVANPAAPVVESSIKVPGGVMGFWKRPLPDIYNNVVYMTGRNGLYGFDVSDPANPTQTVYYPYPDDFTTIGVGDVYIRDGLAYVAVMPPESRQATSGGGGLAIYKLDTTRIFASTWRAGSVDGGRGRAGLDYGMDDILMWDGTDWTKWFDGAAAGLQPVGRWKHNINAFSVLDTDTGEVVMSFTQNRQRVADLGFVDGYDLLLWDGAAFSRWFEGEQVGLTNKTQEKIDSLHVLDEPPAWSAFAGDDCLAYLLISTQGPGRVPAPAAARAPAAALPFRGEDVLGFCATSLGNPTAGSWEMVLDGSAEGVTSGNITSISLGEDEQTLYLTTRRQFFVDSAFGGHSMIFTFDMTTGDFSGPCFRFMDHLGIHAKVDGLHVGGAID